MSALFMLLAGGSTAAALGARLHDHLSGESLALDAMDRARLGARSVGTWDTRARGAPRADVTACLTTTPTRIGLLGPCLSSLLAQSRVPSRIELYVPAFSAREARRYDVPAWLANLSCVTLVPCADVGPATKLLPALSRHPPDAALLVVDDDRVFPPRFVEELTSWAMRRPDAIVAASGWVVPPDLTDRPTTLGANLRQAPPVPVRARRVRAPSPVDVVQGQGGYVVRPRFFDATALADFTRAPGCARWVDDVWISGHARAPKLVVPLTRGPFAPLRHRARFDHTALGRLNRGPGPDDSRNNTIVLRHLRDRWMCQAEREG
jgi:hypothetical protein